MISILALVFAFHQPPQIGAALNDGARLVYESAGVKQAPWTYDSVRVLQRIGFDRCVLVARRAQPVRESCVRGDTLFERSATGAHAATRPIGPNMTFSLSTAAGNVVHYMTGTDTSRHVPGAGSIAIRTTTIVTRDTSGAIVRRLREHYAPSLLTAVWGVFEEPDGKGGWTTVREFTLGEVQGSAR